MFFIVFSYLWKGVANVGQTWYGRHVLFTIVRRTRQLNFFSASSSCSRYYIFVFLFFNIRRFSKLLDIHNSSISIFKRERSSQRFYISLFFSPTEVTLVEIVSIDSNRFNQFKYRFKLIQSIQIDSNSRF